MARDASRELIEQWQERCGDENQPSREQVNALRSAVRGLLPDLPHYAAATLGDGKTVAVLALSDNQLFIGTVTGTGDEMSVTVRNEPVIADRVSVRMVETTKASQRRVDWFRTWTFIRDGEPFLTMKTVISSGDWEHEGTPQAEAFARDLARASGWQVPTDGE